MIVQVFDKKSDLPPFASHLQMTSKKPGLSCLRKGGIEIFTSNRTSETWNDPLNEGEYRMALQKIWKKEQRKG